MYKLSFLKFFKLDLNLEIGWRHLAQTDPDISKFFAGVLQESTNMYLLSKYNY